MAKPMRGELTPAERNTLLYSVVIPAHNEERNILPTLRGLATPGGDSYGRGGSHGGLGCFYEGAAG